MLLISISLVLMGCAVTERPAIDRSPLTLAAPPTVQYLGTCEDERTLEQWMQPVTFHQREFLSTLLTLPGSARHDAYPRVERLAQLRDRLSAVPVPDCAATTHEAFVLVMSSIVDDMQRYINGEALDPADIVTMHEAAFVQAQGLLDTLYVELTGESLFAVSTSTPDVP